MIRIARVFAWLYALASVGVVAFALVIDVLMRNDPREHMLPDMLMLLVGMPLSLVASWFLTLLPNELAFSTWIQYPLFLACPILQSLCLLWLTRSPLGGHRSGPA